MKRNKGFKKSDILYHIVKRWRLIVMFTALGLVSGILISGFFYLRGEMSKEFKITSSFAVIAVDENGNYASAGKSPTRSDTEMANDLTDSAIYIVKSQRNIETMIETLGLKGVSARDVTSNLTASRYNETEIVELTLLWRSENEGIRIMDAINRVTDQSILDILKIGRISVINPPKASFIIGGNIGGIPVWTMIGFIIGMVICILQWFFSPTIINEAEIEDTFGIATLGSVPFDAKYALAKPTDRLDLPVTDSINSVTHLLIDRMKQKDYHRVYITSAVHGEGKTRLIADIALRLSLLGKKTLIIDCDMRNPFMGSLFFDELPYEKTLNALYRGECDKLDAITRVNGCLDILPMILEKVPDNFNDALLHQIADVMEGYDYVLIDAAPVGEDAEVMRLNGVVDAAMLAVRFDYANIETIRMALLRLSKSSVPIVGAVFNDVINWKQTILYTPKHLKTAIKRELKRRNKKQKTKKKKSAGA